MSIYTRIITLIFVSVVVNSCKNDLELNAPYKEYPSIYAVINPQDKIQMIRINKVFLGEGDANVMAKVADSVNYQPGELSVTLTGPDAKVITFRDSMIQASEGAFNTSQRVYVTSEKIGTSGKYKLTVKNNKTGNIFTASANSLDSINAHWGYLPFTAFPTYPYPPGTSPGEYINYEANKGSVRFPPNGAAVYQLVIRMHFFDNQGVGGNIPDYVDYVFGNKLAKDVTTISNTIKVIDYSFTPDEVFGAAGVALSRKKLAVNTLGRKMYKIEFLVFSSTSEYVDYLAYNAPSLNIAQQKPLYSNFDKKAALGIFTFRARASVTKEMGTTFINRFATHPSTCRFEFVDVNDQKLGCQ